ncbi:hypothetical protein B4U79_19038, partial [Dinothrombium tinctorium]
MSAAVKIESYKKRKELDESEGEASANCELDYVDCIFVDKINNLMEANAENIKNGVNSELCFDLNSFYETSIEEPLNDLNLDNDSASSDNQSAADEQLKAKSSELFSLRDVRTPRMGKHFEAICLNSVEDHIYIASSNLGGMCCESFIHQYRLSNERPILSDFGINLKLSSCSQMIFMSKHQQLVAGFDSGALMIANKELSHCKICNAHDGYYTGLVLDRNEESCLVTTGIDCSLRAWDLDKGYVFRIIPFPHISTITGVDFVSNSDQNLITSGT